MIITSPTGSYNTILPTGPQDRTSIIYTISNNAPPRSELTYPKLPDGVKILQRSDRLFDNLERRYSLGPLIYITKAPGAVKVNNGGSLATIGQILEFDSTPVEPTLIGHSPNNIETKHNDYYIDQDSLGIASGDQTQIANVAMTVQQTILDDIAELQRQRLGLEVDITNYQKVINEINRMLVGLNTILNIISDASTIQVKTNLLAKLAMVTSQLNIATTELIAIPTQIQSKRDNLTALTQLVK